MLNETVPAPADDKKHLRGESDTANGKSATGPFAAVTVLFFFWGFITVMNDVLIPFLKSSFELSYFQAGLVQFAFFGAFFVISLIYFAFSVSSGEGPRHALPVVGVAFAPQMLLVVSGGWRGFVYHRGLVSCSGVRRHEDRRVLCRVWRWPTAGNGHRMVTTAASGPERSGRRVLAWARKRA